jgi:hypothetical protein
MSVNVFFCIEKFSLSCYRCVVGSKKLICSWDSFSIISVIDNYSSLNSIGVLSMFAILLLHMMKIS